MQRYEVEQLSLFSMIGLPVMGWYGGAQLGNVPLRPMPQALTAALQATTHNPYLAGGAALGLLAGIGISQLLTLYADSGFRGAPFSRWLRGSRLENWHFVRRLIRAANRRENARRRKEHPKSGPLVPIMIGHMPMPLHLENRNTMICASTGSGKSITIEGMIAAAVKRRDKMAIIDPNGDFYSKFSFPGDVILNPYDARSAGWSVFNEIRGAHDFERMAKSIIPPVNDPNEEQWCGYARDVLADTMRRLNELGRPDQAELVELLTDSDVEKLKTFLHGTRSHGYFRQNAEKAVASIRFLLNKYVRGMGGLSKGDFSLYRWIHDPEAGNLFITWREDMRSSQKPLVATWIDTICATILSHEPRTAKRTWLFLDELESLGRLESFVPAATKGRKHGLRIVATIQDWAQLDETYGRDSAKTLLACFRNYVIFGASNAYNSDKASEILGDHEVERYRISYQLGGRGGGRTRAGTHEKERMVMDSEISNLPDLTGYVMFAEEFPIAKITIPLLKYPARAVALEAK